MLTPFETLQQFEQIYDLLKPAHENTSETFAWFSGVPHPLFNAVMHLKTENDLSEKVDDLIAVNEKMPIVFWVHNENGSKDLTVILKDKGFQPAVTCPLMVWDVKPVTNYHIEEAHPEIFFDIIATTYHFDDRVKEGFAKLHDNPNVENYMIYYDGQPAGTGTLITNGKIGGIFNIATLPEYQKKGCATAMMQFLMNRASVLGLENVVLLSNQLAEKIYLDLGFANSMNIDVYAR